MRAYLITGNPGSGKSTLAAELTRRGLIARDADDLASWEDRAAGQHTRARHPRRGHRTRHASPPRTGRGQVSWPPNATKTC
jgi:dephospho-CoA kinase